MRIVNSKMKSVFILGFFVFFTIIYVCEALRYKTIPDPESMIYRTKSVSTSVLRKTCLLKYDEGPCRAELRMYYYDTNSKKCEPFYWGGCQGNGNRFETAEECSHQCLSTDSSANQRPNYCKLTFDYGFCFGVVKRYYYDHLYKTCKETIYSGCGGNKNNFYNMEACEQICRFGHAPLPLAGPAGAADGEDSQVFRAKVLVINPSQATTARGKDQEIPDEFTKWVTTTTVKEN